MKRVRIPPDNQMPEPTRIVDLHERDARLFPRSEIVDEIGQSRILPETRQLGAVELRDVGDGVLLRATGVIGYLPLTSTITLNIVPKFPLGNLWYMLDHADEQFDRVLPVLRRYELNGERAPQHLLARSFCYFLARIVSFGLARLYPSVRTEGYFQPKIEFGATVSRFISRGDGLRSVSDSFVFSRDIAANRTLKAACIEFSRIVPRRPGWFQERAVLDDALASLAALMPHRFNNGDFDLAETVPIRLREDYDGALSLYSILRGYTDVGFSFEPSGRKLPSFLFRLDSVFESFVRNRCRPLMQPALICIGDGNHPGQHGMLFVDNKRYPTKPDMVFKRQGDVIGLGEIKYKPRLDEVDRYQLISHTVAAGTRVGFWISPASSTTDAGLEYTGAIKGGISFYHYRLDIGGDLEAASAEMAAALTEKLAQT